MRILLLFLISILAQTANAQNCSSTTPADASNKRYTLAKNGTVLDKQTGLTWMRCALGQTWNKHLGCTGSPQYMPWQTALYMAENTTFADQKDWRLPNQKELESLVERQCYDPAINSAIFYGVDIYGETSFWSSTPHIDNIRVWGVDFTRGLGISSIKDNVLAVRLVTGRIEPIWFWFPNIEHLGFRQK